MSNQDIRTERRRLSILQLLKEDPDYSANDTLLQDMLDYAGHGVSLDRVKSDLAWLEEQELVSLKQIPGCTIATLRNRGLDVAGGVTTLPGVARPRPE